MEYMLKVLNLEKEIDELRVDENHIEYIDFKKKLTGLDKFARKISEADLKESDIYSFLERVKEYKSKIKQYKSRTGLNNLKSGMVHTIISFLLGIFSVVIGIKLKDMYKLSKNRRMNEMANIIYKKLSGVEVDNA